MIIKGLNSNDLRIKEKYLWLKDQYLPALEYFKTFYEFTNEEKKFIEIETTS